MNWGRFAGAAPALVLGGLGLALLVLAGMGGGPVAAADAAVSMPADNPDRFSPQTVNIDPNDTVTWTNNDNVAHSAVRDGSNQALTGTLSQGGSDSFTFTNEEVVTYHCGIHGITMTGTIIVGTPATATNTPVTPATNTAIATNTQATASATATPTATPTRPVLDNRVYAPLVAKGQ
ncbi:MAG: cupredoxin domain-containing protein [Tepidiformaceae bacterium]